MNRVISYFLVFVFGFIVCAAVIHQFYGSPVGFSGVEQAQNMPRRGVELVDNGKSAVKSAAKQVSSYVVSIDTIGRPVIQQGQMGGFFGMGEPQEVVPRGKASGVIFTSDGYILTNNHVVDGAAKLSVTLYDGKQYNAELIGRDPKTDLAVIKISANGLSFAKFANSDTLSVGDWVIAVGNALGLGPTVTVGVVSAFRSNVQIDKVVLEQVIQTDASINRGNSGGALADINGSLIGINSAIASSGPDGGSIGIGFAVPSNVAKRIATELVKNGQVLRPWLGVSIMPFNRTIREMAQKQGVRNLPDKDGALIREVFPNSPAAQAGLQPEDIILKINGTAISGDPADQKNSVPKLVGQTKIGDRLLMEVWHASNGSISTVGARVGTMPKDLGR